MSRSAIPFFGYVTLTLAIAGACSAPPPEIPEPEQPPNQGGTGSSGGSSGNGGTTGGVGGATGGVGGATGGVGGATGGAGGALAGAGGSVAGKGGVAGTPATGGNAGTPPGVGGSAGTPAAGGVGGATTAGTGGASAGTAGAGEVPCEASMVVGSDGFVRAPGASGCWHGYASAGKGAMDMESSIMPTSFAMCGMSCMLRISGELGSATSTNNYTGVVFVGFNVNEATGGGAKGTVTPMGSGLVVTYTNTSASPTVRIQISSGSGEATRWCATLTASPATIPYGMFNTKCWNTAETGAAAYTKAPIDTVQLVLPGADMAGTAPFDVTLVSVKDT